LDDVRVVDMEALYVVVDDGLGHEGGFLLAAFGLLGVIRYIGHV
jgi:hypothetical protein